MIQNRKDIVTKIHDTYLLVIHSVYTFFYLLCNIENQLWILKAILSVVIDSNI